MMTALAELGSPGLTAVGDTREQALERGSAAADRIRFVTADVDAKALA
jgi:hypothetical protein